MNKEELVNLNMKDVILNKWKSKLSYPLNHKDIEELENIIDYYERKNQKYKEVIDKLKTNIENDIDGFRTINEFGESNEILELLDIYSDILKEVK